MLLRASCALCGRSGPVVCPGCLAAAGPAPALPPPLHLTTCVSLLDYHRARPLLTGLKNGNHRNLIPPLADAMVAGMIVRPDAVVTWAPTTAARRRQRGFDQAELLARALARRWDLPVAPLLERVGGTAQAGRAAQARRGNPAFRARRAVDGAVVLVDDVVTTGATVTSAARALRTAGASAVHGLVAARAGTPPSRLPVPTP